MTPPIASARKASMPGRARFRCGRSGLEESPDDVAPALDDATRTPSISTSVWPRFAPRNSALDTDPGPPFWKTLHAGWRCRSSARLWRAGTGDLFGADYRDVGEHVCNRRGASRRVTAIGSSIVGPVEGHLRECHVSAGDAGEYETRSKIARRAQRRRGEGSATRRRHPGWAGSRKDMAALAWTVRPRTAIRSRGGKRDAGNAGQSVFVP